MLRSFYVVRQEGVLIAVPSAINAGVSEDPCCQHQPSFCKLQVPGHFADGHLQGLRPHSRQCALVRSIAAGVSERLQSHLVNRGRHFQDSQYLLWEHGSEAQHCMYHPLNMKMAAVCWCRKLKMMLKPQVHASPNLSRNRLHVNTVRVYPASLAD